MPAPGEEHSLCGSVSVLSCAPPRPGSLSVCMTMIVCMKPPAVWLYVWVCVPLPVPLTSLNSVVTAWSPGAPADREARDWHPRPGISPKFSAPRSRRFHVRYCVRADRRGGRRSARLIRAVCVHHHTPPPPPRRPCPAPPDTLVPDRRACGVGPSGGGNPPHAADVSRRAPSHASARPDRPDMYACQLVRALRGGFLWAGAGGPCAWHPKGAWKGEHGTPQSTTSLSLARQVKVKSRPAVDVRARRRLAIPGHFVSHLFFCHSLFRRNANMYSKGTRKVRVQSDRRVRARISPVQLRLQCVASPCRSA